jgi:hypothetical protein
MTVAFTQRRRAHLGGEVADEYVEVVGRVRPRVPLRRPVDTHLLAVQHPPVDGLQRQRCAPAAQQQRELARCRDHGGTR